MRYGRFAQGLVAWPMLWLIACSSSPPQPSHAEIVRGELANIIAIQGWPCGEVIDYTANDRMDYKVVCKTGHVYRIEVTSAGYVDARPHEPAKPLKP
jgi:hypothetical protein